MVLLMNPNAFGARIKAIRTLKKLNQDELARMAGCSRRTIINMELGGNISLHTVFRVVACLGIAVEITDKQVDLRALRELQRQET